MTEPEWTSHSKTVAQLIKELQSFENQDLEVRISVSDGKTSVPVSLVGKVDGKYAVLMNCQSEPSILRHGET
jgi:hypothetical protein